MLNQNKLCLSLILLLIPFQVIFSQDSTQIKTQTNSLSNTTKVLVQITTDQKTSRETGTELTDLIKQELTKPGDVEVVTDSEDARISIMMLQNRTTTGDTLGYIISTIFLSPTVCQGSRNYSYVTSLLSTAKESEFKIAAANLAATFNEIKQSLRKSNQTQ